MKTKGQQPKVANNDQASIAFVGGLTHPDFPGMHALKSEGAQTSCGVSRNPLIQDQA